MIDNLQGTFKLHNGVEMPGFGLGVYKAEDGQEVMESISAAIQTGYRSIDTAAIYGNEKGVGKAVRESIVSREQLFVTTKVWNDDQGYEQTLEAFDKSLDKLGLDYIDLYLIHWAVQGKFVDTWKAMEKLYKDGKVRAIGVCNFQTHHLEEIISQCEVAPMVNQIELHPYLNQKELRDFCAKHKIIVEAWSPLGRGKILDHPVLKEIADRYGKSTAQIILRWDVQHGIVTIPKSVRPERIRENADIFDFHLTEEDMKRIDAMNRNERFGKDPDNFSF